MAKATAVDSATALAARWASAFTSRSGERPTVKIENRKQGYGTLQHARGLEAGVLCLAGQLYSHGLGSHADSEIVLRCAGAIERLRAVVGVDRNYVTRTDGGDKLRLVFSVEVNGKVLWRSPELNVLHDGVPVDLKLPPDTHEVLLKAIAADGNTHCGHADWAALTLTIDGAPVDVGTADAASLSPPTHGPFSFTYAGQPSRDLLATWTRTVSPATRGKGWSASDITWRDPQSGLECRMSLKAFSNYPALDWTVSFKNTGDKDTAILQDIQALDVTWPAGTPVYNGWDAPRLWRARGSPNEIRDFELIEQELINGTHIAMTPGGGRSSNQWLPFFNLYTAGMGILTAIGWTGQWAAGIHTDSTAGLHVHAGIEKTHLRLHPGEEIRGPRILQLLWTGDRIDAHNRWRRLLMQHYVPRAKGKPVTAPLTIMHWGGMTTAEHLKRIAVYKKQRLPHEYYWIDAGWYGLHSTFSPDEHAGDWSRHTGDWRVNPKAHPKGLRPIADAARKAGMKFLLWAEPERANHDTHWVNEHRDWFLPAAGNSSTYLLNLGDDNVRRRVTDFMINLIRENRAGLYRQDFNRDPLPFWRANDAPDRQGISEIRYITGLYAFWDELLTTFPSLIIDNCASGGRRIDLETISRSIPLWRSDWQCRAENDPIGGQTHGMGLSYWVPLHGTGNYNTMPTRALCNTYNARSTMGPAWAFSAFPYESQPIDPKYPWDWFRQMAADYIRARPAFAGDYYPLTHATADPTQWAAYQMDRPDLGEGFLMAFRRKDAPWVTAEFKLRGLDPAATYQVENADTGKKHTAKGKDLLTTGLKIQLPKPDTSALLFYRRTRR